MHNKRLSKIYLDVGAQLPGTIIFRRVVTGADGAVAPSGTCQKGGALSCQNNLVYHSV